MHTLNRKYLAGGAVVLALHSVAASAAQLTGFNISRGQVFTQTSGSTVTFSKANWSANVQEASSEAFDSGNISIPGGGSIGLFDQTTDLGVSAPYQSTLAALNSQFPSGTYIATVHDSTGTNPDESSSINATTDGYPNAPQVTPSTFTSLTGLDTTKPFTVTFGAFAANAAASPGSGSEYVEISDASFNTPVFQFLPTSQNSFNIPANTLSPNTSYTLQIGFSDSIFASGNIQGFATTTTVPFTTAPTPEPGAASLMLVSAGFLIRRSRRAVRGG